MKNSGKKNALIGQKTPKLIFSDCAFIFKVPILIASTCSCFFDTTHTKTELPMAMSHNLRLEVLVWGCKCKPVRLPDPSANPTAALRFWHCWSADDVSLEPASFGISKLCNPNPIQQAKLISIPLNQHILSKVLGLFFRLGPKILVQATCSAWMHSDHQYGLRIS